MNDPFRTSWYVSRRVDAPAVVVLNALHGLLADGPLSVGADRATLAVDPVDDRRGSRAARGRLSVPGRLGTRVAVDLEVEAWSASECELALRPSGRLLPGDPVRYGEAAALTLERFRDVIARMLLTPVVDDEEEAWRRAS